MVSKIDELKEKHRKQISDLTDTIEQNSLRHKQEMGAVCAERDAALSQQRNDAQESARSADVETELRSAKEKCQGFEEQLAQLRTSRDELQNDRNELENKLR